MRVDLTCALFFLGITIFHWGQGDRYLAVKLHRAAYLERSALLKALHILSRGSIPILLPRYFGNETYREFLEAMIRQGGQVDYDLSWISQNPLFFLLVPLLLTVLQICLSLPQLQDGEGRALCRSPFGVSNWTGWAKPCWAFPS